MEVQDMALKISMMMDIRGNFSEDWGIIIMSDNSPTIKMYNELLTARLQLSGRYVEETTDPSIFQVDAKTMEGEELDYFLILYDKDSTREAAMKHAGCRYIAYDERIILLKADY